MNVQIEQAVVLNSLANICSSVWVQRSWAYFPYEVACTRGNYKFFASVSP